MSSVDTPNGERRTEKRFSFICWFWFLVLSIFIFKLDRQGNDENSNLSQQRQICIIRVLFSLIRVRQDAILVWKLRVFFASLLSRALSTRVGSRNFSIHYFDNNTNKSTSHMSSRFASWDAITFFFFSRPHFILRDCRYTSFHTTQHSTTRRCVKNVHHLTTTRIGVRERFENRVISESEL